MPFIDRRKFPGDYESVGGLLEEEWFRGPTMLASTSGFRQEMLKAVGFKDITTFSVPEAEERKIMDGLLREGRFLDIPVAVLPIRADITPAIASRKLEYLIETQRPPANTFLCAADTMTRHLDVHLEDGEYQGG